MSGVPAADAADERGRFNSSSSSLSLHAGTPGGRIPLERRGHFKSSSSQKKRSATKNMKSMFNDETRKIVSGVYIQSKWRAHCGRHA